jgi:hypothetical protein
LPASQTSMRLWAFVQLIAGSAMLPEALWGAAGMIGILMPALMAGMWPLNSALVILWFLSALVAVASATLSLLSAALLLATRGAGRGLQLSFVGTLCFWADVVGRESTFIAVRTHGSFLFNLYILSVAMAATVTTARLFWISRGLKVTSLEGRGQI